MKVEAGKKYISKGGFIAGPMRNILNPLNNVAFFRGVYCPDGSGKMIGANWTESGRFCGRKFDQMGEDEGPCTLVKEFTDEPPLTA